MRVGAGAARTVVLAAWAAVFAVLWAAGEGERYLGPRTQWVIPFGALALGVTAVAHGALAAARRRTPAPLTRGEAVGSVALFLPMLALLVVPEPTLGAQAASKKRPSNSVLISQVSPAREDGGAPASTAEAPFVDVAVASLSPAEGVPLGLVPGAAVRAHGIVLHDSDVPGTFALARFFVSCCAADALPIVVPVARGTGEPPPEDEWLLVSGTLVRRGSALAIAPATVERTDEPASPYLSASNDGPPPAGDAPAARPARAAASPAAAPAAAPPARTPTPRDRGRYAGRAARVYDRYFQHCKEFTPDALAYPKRARSASEAARMFAGPQRPLQPPAYDGCLAGLQAGVATITLRDVIQALLGAESG